MAIVEKRNLLIKNYSRRLESPELKMNFCEKSFVKPLVQRSRNISSAFQRLHLSGFFPNAGCPMNQRTKDDSSPGRFPFYAISAWYPSICTWTNDELKRTIYSTLYLKIT